MFAFAEMTKRLEGTLRFGKSGQQAPQSPTEIREAPASASRTTMPLPDPPRLPPPRTRHHATVDDSRSPTALSTLTHNTGTTFIVIIINNNSCQRAFRSFSPRADTVYTCFG